MHDTVIWYLGSTERIVKVYWFLYIDRNADDKTLSEFTRYKKKQAIT